MTDYALINESGSPHWPSSFWDFLLFFPPIGRAPEVRASGAQGVNDVAAQIVVLVTHDPCALRLESLDDFFRLILIRGADFEFARRLRKHIGIEKTNRSQGHADHRGGESG